MSFEAGINQLGQSDIKAAIANEYTEDALFITDFVNALEECLLPFPIGISNCAAV